MMIQFACEAQGAFERAVAALPSDYTIGVVLDGDTYVDRSDLTRGQDVRLVAVRGDELRVLDLDPTTQEPDGTPERVIDLNNVSEIHVY